MRGRRRVCNHWDVSNLMSNQEMLLGGGFSEVPPFSATGGTITTDGADTIHKFTGTGSFVVNNAPIGFKITYLVVAGGGGSTGNQDNEGAGGGGAGGLLYVTNAAVSSGTYVVTVGGAGTANSTTANNGSNSVITGISSTAIGGGAGFLQAAGNSGGSGGGGGGFNQTRGGGAGTSGQGNSGGTGLTLAAEVAAAVQMGLAVTAQTQLVAQQVAAKFLT